MQLRVLATLVVATILLLPIQSSAELNEATSIQDLPGYIRLGATAVDIADMPTDPRAATHAAETAHGLRQEAPGNLLIATKAAIGGGVHLVGINAAEGTQAWATPPIHVSGVNVWTSAGDLDGDGDPDVVVRLLRLGEPRSSNECHGPACASSYDLPWTWTLRAISGRDGATLWEQRVEGGYQDSSARLTDETIPVSVTQGGSLSRELVFDVQLAPDVTGDGRSDVIVNAVSIAYRSARVTTGTLSPGLSVAATLTRGWVIDGASGTNAFRVSALSERQSAYLQGAGHLDQDGIADLTWTQNTPTHLSISAIGGGVFAPLWSRATANAEGVMRMLAPLRVDLGDDGSDDLLLHALGPGPFDRTITLLSGADGQITWGDVPGGPLVFPLKAAAGMQLVVVRSRLTDAGFEVISESLSPTTGVRTNVHTFVVPPGEGFGFVFLAAQPMPQMDGLEGDDLLVHVIDAQFSFETFTWTTLSTLFALDGATMSEIDKRDFDGVAYAASASSLDAVPGEDVLVTVATDIGSTVHAWSPAAASTSWSVEMSGYSTWRAGLEDSSGDGRSEIALTMMTAEGPTTLALDGASGSTSWSVAATNTIGVA